MNSLNRKSVLLAAATLLPAAVAPTAQASSHYSGSVDFSYTITANNRNSNGGSQFLSITDLFEPIASVQSGASSYSPSYLAFSGLGVAHSVSLRAQDSVQLGAAISEYFSNLLIAFENTSNDINDIFDINIDFSYALSARAEGESADVDATFSYSNENFALDNFDFAHASIYAGFAEVFGFDSFGFVLSAGQSDNLYFNSAVSGQLEATVVPVPAAIWLFGSGLAGLLGMQRKPSRRT